MMQYLDLTLPGAAENLALDEALLLEAESGRGREVLRFWEWPQPAVILGSGCRLTDDVNESACRADGVPILRRSSGGGTVMLGKGCVCYSLVLSYERSPCLKEIRPSYAYILEQVRQALLGILPNIAIVGTSDLAAAGLKFSGNSQQRKRCYLLHHGTLLYDFDIEQVGHYLRMPRRQPEYRRQREHAMFLANLPVGAAELKERLRGSWCASEELIRLPMPLVMQLAREKYAREEWIRRR
jgi:lipoate-protein ligase A